MLEMLTIVSSILIMKLTAIVVGYKIVQLGYEALIRGIKGEFDFGGKLTNHMEIKLLSASPGLFFVLFGSFIICWALFVEKPVSFSKEVISAAPHSPSVQPEPESTK
jgi:putative Ca2+/H+ antiporter (TMEM165/GDT1 family)